MVSGKTVKTACKRDGEDGGSGEELTTETKSRSASSGEAEAGQGGEADLRRTEVEEEGMDGVRGCPALHGPVMTKRGTRRSSWAARGVVGTAMVAATASGGDGRARVAVREKQRRGERATSEGEGREVSGRLRGVRGGRESSPARSRRWRTGARALSPSSAYWQR